MGSSELIAGRVRRRYASRGLAVVGATAAAAVISAGTGVTESHGYALGGQKWPTRTITYHSTAPGYAEAIRSAVRAWNTSGVGIRFRPASRRRAMLQIVHGRYFDFGVGGIATLGWAARGTITRRDVAGVEISGYPVPCGMRMRSPFGGRARVRCYRGPHVWLPKASRRAAADPRVRNAMTNTVAHELGHILGLKHVRRRCAVMALDGKGTCSDPPHPWQLRCRVLEADDVKGAISRYGGRMRPLGPEFCDRYPAPAAPSGLAASFNPAQRLVELTWRNAPTLTLRHVRYAIARDACPAAPPEARHPARPSAAGSAAIRAEADGGRFCVAVWSEDEFGRVSPPATAWVDVPPGSQPEPE